MRSKTNFTLTMIKPDAVSEGYMGAILEKISIAGFKIIALKLTQFSKQDAKNFYEIHKERPFFEDLVEFMTSGPVVAAVLQKDNAVEDFRTLIGSTNPEDAVEGTIRQLYGSSIRHNAIHGSDSTENALRESLFHFADREIFEEIFDYL